MNRLHFGIVPVALVILMNPLPAADPPQTITLEPALRQRCLAVLRDALKSDEFWPAMHAAEALTFAGKQREVLDSLAKRTESDDQKRCGLAREAVRAGDKTNLAILFEILDKPGSNGHMHAAESLFKMAEIDDGKKLTAAFSQNENPRLKLMAAAALARRGRSETLETVRKYIPNADLELRKIAAWILGQLGPTTDIPALREQGKQETDPIGRAYFAHALALLSDADGVKSLGENLGSANPAVRTYSAEFAGYCRAIEFRESLVKLLDDPTLDVRVRAAQSLIVLSQPPGKLGLPFARLPKNP